MRLEISLSLREWRFLPRLPPLRRKQTEVCLLSYIIELDGAWLANTERCNELWWATQFQLNQLILLLHVFNWQLLILL